jgi:hypothetical protein
VTSHVHLGGREVDAHGRRPVLATASFGVTVLEYGAPLPPAVDRRRSESGMEGDDEHR